MTFSYAKILLILGLSAILFACAGFTPVKRFKVCGNVVAQNGRPVQAARVRLEGPSGNRDASTNQYGWFAIDRARLDGRCSLVVRADGFTEMEIKDLGFPTDSKIQFKIKLYPDLTPAADKATGAGVISGRVIDDMGAPIPGASVLLPGTPYGAAGTFDGLYLIPDIPAGRYSVAAQLVGHMRVRYGRVAVLPGSVTAVDFVLYPNRVIVARIEGCALPMFDRYITTNRWTRSDYQIEPLPIKQAGEILEFCPGIVRR